MKFFKPGIDHPCYPNGFKCYCPLGMGDTCFVGEVEEDCKRNRLWYVVKHIDGSICHDGNINTRFVPKYLMYINELMDNINTGWWEEVGNPQNSRVGDGLW